MEKKTKTYRIAVSGPESTGKSVLAEALAQHYNTVWVPEYSRQYLEELQRDYLYEDIVHIARGQFMLEEELFAQAGQFLFCDTDFLVSKIWSEVKFGRCDPWIEMMYGKHVYDLYLLCKPDLPWEVDPLRENPDDRERLFDMYLQNLQNTNYPFEIIQGVGKERLEHAIRIIDTFIL